MKCFVYGVLIILAMLTNCQVAKADNSFSKEGKVFSASINVKSSSDIKTDYSWADKDGNTSPIFLHKYTKGEKVGRWTVYVFRVSKKTGKQYKYYLPNGEDIANEILKETRAE